MSLLPVGTRVKIVGPDCNGSNWLLGRSFSIVAISNTPHPICIGHKFGCVWFPASSIQEIKEQTVKIETQEQAKAAKEFHAHGFFAALRRTNASGCDRYPTWDIQTNRSTRDSQGFGSS